MCRSHPVPPCKSSSHGMVMQVIARPFLFRYGPTLGHRSGSCFGPTVRQYRWDFSPSNCWSFPSFAFSFYIECSTSALLTNVPHDLPPRFACRSPPVPVPVPVSTPHNLEFAISSNPRPCSATSKRRWRPTSSLSSRGPTWRAYKQRGSCPSHRRATPPFLNSIRSSCPRMSSLRC